MKPASYHNRYPPQRFFRTIETTSSMERVLLNRQLYRNPPYITRYHSILRQGYIFGLQRMSLHLFKSKTQRRRNGMRTPGEIIAPDHDRLTSREKAIGFIDIAYRMFHRKTGAPDVDHAHTNLYGIRTHQGQHVGTRNFFDEQAIVTAIGACLNTRIVRWMRNDTFYLLMFLSRGPLLQPRMELVKIITSCLLIIGKVDGIIDMGQRVQVTKSNLHWQPAGKGLTHKCSHLAFNNADLIVTDTFPFRQHSD